MNHRCVTIWLKYAEMEMKLRQINHARNIWDRAVTILPRVNQFWYVCPLLPSMIILHNSCESNRFLGPLELLVNTGAPQLQFENKFLSSLDHYMC